MRPLIIFGLIALGLYTPLGTAQAQALHDTFITSDEDGKVKFYQRNQEYIGQLVWSAKPTKDVNNPDPAKRDQSTVGQEVFFLKKTEDNEWEGEVYNSRDGRTYSVTVWFEDQQTLKVRGYVGHPWLGQTETMFRE